MTFGVRLTAGRCFALVLLVWCTLVQQADATERSARELRIHGGATVAQRVTPVEPVASAGHLPATGGGHKQPAMGLATAGDCAAEPPPAARAAGLTKLAFCDDFSSPATIDLDGTLEDGFKWYISGLPFNFRASSRNAYRVRDGILTVHPDVNQAQLSFLSAVVPKGSRTPVGWYIDREVDGWYAEARLSHEKKTLSKGFTAFWTMDMCHLYRYPQQCSVFVEPDFYEFIHGGEIRAIHLHQNPTGRRQMKVDTWMNYHPRISRGIDWSSFNTVALRALPDSVNHFVNDQQVTQGASGDRTVNGSFSWMRDVVAGPTTHGEGVGRYPIIFGSGPEMPFRVDWVKVWVKP